MTFSQKNDRMETTATRCKVYTVTTERNQGNILEGYNKALNKGKCLAQNLNFAEPVVSKGAA